LTQSQAQVEALGHELAEQRTALAAGQAMLAECMGTLAQYETRLAERDADAARYAAAAAQSAELVAQVESLRQENDNAHRRIAELQAATHDWWSVANQLNLELQALHASTSWRVTAPLRALRDLVAGLPGLAPRVARWSGRRVRVAGRPLVLWAVRKVLGHPGLRARAMRVLARHPGLKQYLRGFAGRAGLVAFPAEAGVQAAAAPMPAEPISPLSTAIEIIPPCHLGTRAGRIYGQLKRQSS
jgi:hypothetical protein